jgi:PmbA protein
MAYGESSRKLDELDIRYSAAESVRKAISYLGASTIKTGTYSVVLDQETTASLIDIVADLFCAPEIHKGRSMMKGQLGNKVASPCITLIDNGRIAWKSGSSSWDSEGVPTGETLLIENGIASSYLYNLQYAWKDGVQSTGNASRGLSSLPDVDTTNIILKPGTESGEDIISSIKKGLYITEFMGLHTVDSISGNFSIGAKGLMIENGELTHAVSGVTIASNLLDFIKRITVVGSDLKYFGSVATPTVVVEGIVIAGD